MPKAKLKKDDLFQEPAAKPGEAPAAPFKDRLSATHQEIKNNPAGEPKNRGGRPAGYRKIGGKWVPPDAVPEVEAQAAQTGNLFAAPNMEALFKGVFPQATPQELNALAVSAASSSGHLPDWAMKYADVALFATLIVQMSLKYYVFKQPEGIPAHGQEENLAPQSAAPQEAPSPAPAAGQPAPGNPATGKPYRTGGNFF